MIRDTFDEELPCSPKYLTTCSSWRCAVHTQRRASNLGLGPDEIGRDRLAQLTVTLAEVGEKDPEVIRAKAVHQLQPPAASSFYRG
jgi:hypothetical protein